MTPIERSVYINDLPLDGRFTLAHTVSCYGSNLVSWSVGLDCVRRGIVSNEPCVRIDPFSVWSPYFVIH